DLLVDRDGLEIEALFPVELRDLEVRLGRLLLGVPLRVEVADLQPDPDVLRILLDDAQVLLDRLVELALLDELLRGLHDLVLIDGHGATTPPSRSGRVEYPIIGGDTRQDK